MNTIAKLKLLLLVLLLFYPFFHGVSQSIKSFDFKDEFPNNTITSIEQDTLGFMWLGSNKGIFRFDGYSTQPFLHPIVSERYINFLSHKNKKLYIGTNEGLFIYDYINNECNICSEYLKSKNIVSYQYSGQYQIVATDKEIFLFDHSWKFINRALIYKGELNNHIICIAIDKNQNILVGTESGLEIIYINDNSNIRVENIYTGKRIAQIFIDSHQYAWICREEEILHGSLDAINSLGISGFQHVAYNHEVMVFFEYAEQVWIGTRGAGITIYDYDNGKIVLKNKLLMDESGESDLKNTINDIYKDRNSKIWICTLEGLYLYNDEEDSNFHTIRYNKNKKNVPSSNIISSIFCDDNNYLWLATSNGINKLKWTDKKNYSITQYIDSRNLNGIIANNKIQCITKFKDHILLVSTKNTIKFFDSEKCIFYDDEDLSHISEKYGMRYVRSTFRDHKNNIWLAFSEGGVGVINTSNEQFTKLNYPENIRARHRAISRDVNGNIWVSSDDDGLYCLQLNEKLEVINTKLYSKKQFEDFWITSLYIDRQNRIWVGTSNGLYRYNANQDKFLKLEFPYSRKSAYIGGIIQDNLENIWAVSLRGIYKINPEDTIYYYELNVTQDIVKTWYILGTCINQTGEIFIGGVNGLNSFNPIKIVSDTYPHHIYISDVEVMNKKVSPDGKHFTKEINSSEELILSYKDYQFSLSFSSLYYKEPQKIEYAYMLEGFDSDWITTDASRHYASYSNLKSGEYVFKVKSTNASGMWLDNIKYIRIIVETAPWKSWWAYLIYIAVIIGILSLVMRIFNLGSKLRHKDALNKWKVNYYTNLSYGLKVPLTLIYAPLQYLLKNYDQLAEIDVKQMLHTMSGSVSKLSEQVSHLTEFKKIPIGEYDVQLSKVDAISVFKGICNLFSDEMVTKHITYSFESNIEAVTTIIDITKIEVALYNILEDSILYISKNGKIEIKCMVDSRDYKLCISIIAVRNITDTVTSQELNTRFSIAYDYIKMHHSELTVKKTDENKTRKYSFNLLLGSSHYTAKEIKTLDKEKSFSLLPISPSSNKIIDEAGIDYSNTLPIIYLYEGDKDIDLFIKNIFIKKFDIQIIADSIDIKHLLDKMPLLVIFDIVKEEDYKFDLCRKMKDNQILSAIPVIFISSLSAEVVEQKAYEMGADMFMTKPFDIANLNVRIKQLLDVRAAIKENIRKELIVNPKEVMITSDDDKFIASIITIIEENMTNTDFNIDILSSKLNISRSTLYRRIMEITNQSPSDLIRRTRMKRAASLLERTSHSVAEISYMVGYWDQRYFGQSFKKEFGMTPKQYAKKKKLD